MPRIALLCFVLLGFWCSTSMAQVVILELDDSPLVFDPVGGGGGGGSSGEWRIPLTASGASEPVIAFSFGGHALFSGFETQINFFTADCEAMTPVGDPAAAGLAQFSLDLSTGVFADAEFFQSDSRYNLCLPFPEDPHRRDFSVAAVMSFSSPMVGQVLASPTLLGELLVECPVGVTEYSEIAFFGGAAFFPAIVNEVLYEDGMTAPLALSPVTLSFETASLFRRGQFAPGPMFTLPDVIASINYLLNSGSPPGCLDSIDANDDGFLNLSDPILVLSAVMGLPTGLPIGPCAPDSTPDNLDCAVDNCSLPL